MWRIKIINERQRTQVSRMGNEVWLGRAPTGDYGTIRIDDPFVSKQQLRITRDVSGQVLLENVGRALVQVADGSKISRGQSAQLQLPVAFKVGHTDVIICGSTYSREAGVPTLEEPHEETPATFCLMPPSEALTPNTVGSWFERLLAVHRSAAGSDEFYDETAAAVVELVGLDRGLVLLRQGTTWIPKAFCTTHGHDEFGFSHSVLQQVVTEKRTIHDVPTGGLVTSSLLNVEAVVASPIFNEDNEVVGVVYGSRDVARHSGAVQPLQAQFVQLLANAVGAGLIRAEQQRQLLRYEDELAIGRRIQASFLPATTPSIQGWQIAASFSPAREVSGDFYDLFYLPNSRKLFLAIADVCDKGVGAALFMAVVRTLVRAFATRPPVEGDNELQRGVGRVVELVHEYIMANHSESNMFATLFLGLLDTDSGRLIYVNAGHEPPIVISPDGTTSRLSPNGPAIGMFPDSNFHPTERWLAPGETFVAFTDGITEARDLAGGFYGVPRLIELLAARTALMPDRLLSSVADDVREHLGIASQSDDIAMLAFLRIPHP